MKRAMIEPGWDPVNIYTAFGFLGGKELKEANVTNLGLHDRTFFVLALLYEHLLTKHRRT